MWFVKLLFVSCEH